MILGSARPRARLLSAAAGPVLVLALAACSGGTPGGTSGGPAAQPSATSPSESPTPSPTPTQVQRSLLSGRAGAKDGPVLAVKLDNTSFANPHSGLKQADVVYVEEVEGGLTRYAAIYSSEIPTAIGPIRSARITDIDLLAQYGKVAFAYSGAQTKLRPVIAGANLYDVSGDRGAFGYWRQSGRQAPYDFFGNGQKLLARAPQAAVARDVGFRFATDVPAGGQPVTRVVANYPSARMAFSWDAASKRWLVALDGTPARATEGGVLGGTTVIIQYVQVVPSIYHDHWNGNTPMSQTIGSGPALVLRDGRAYSVTWSRPSAGSGTHYTKAGQDFPLAPGQVWVALVKSTRPATVTPVPKPSAVAASTSSSAG